MTTAQVALANRRRICIDRLLRTETIETTARLLADWSDMPFHRAYWLTLKRSTLTHNRKPLPQPQEHR